MKLGICTTDFKRQGVNTLMKTIAALGFESIQFNFSSIDELDFHDTPEWEIPEAVDESALDLILDATRSAGLSIACVNGTFNTAHPDKAVRDEGIRRFDGFARAVRYLGCPLVTICTGTRSTEGMWTPHPDNQTDAAFLDSLEAVRAMTKIAERYGITLLIETEASNVVDTPEKAGRMMAEIGSEHLKIVMDCANLFHIGDARAGNAKHVIGHAFDILARDVLLAHAKDILPGPGIEFCAAGEGIVDFPYFFERLSSSGYRGDMIAHGIYDVAKMPDAVRLLKPMVVQYGS